jgi:hypothetical protein
LLRLFLVFAFFRLIPLLLPFLFLLVLSVRRLRAGQVGHAQGGDGAERDSDQHAVQGLHFYSRHGRFSGISFDF